MTKSIDDLIKESKAQKTNTPSTDRESAEEKLKSKLGAIRLKEKEEEVKNKAVTTGMPYINLTGFPIPPEAIGAIPEKQAEDLQAVCFFNAGEQLRVGAVFPEKTETKELVYQLEERFHGKTALYLISEASFKKAFALYAAIPKIKPIIKGVEITEAEIKKFETEIKSYKDLGAAIQKAKTSDVVSMIIAQGLKVNTSDVHVQAEEAEVKFRFRLDGVLNDVATLPKARWPEMISRIKLLAGLKINISDIPQDGRFTIFLNNDRVEVRVSTIPSSFGESVVMRFLRGTVQGVKFSDLGLRGEVLEEFTRQTEKTNGMIITTGPTGSGKTTTLYAILNKLNAPDVKIITLEDPVEYRLPGITQSQIDASKDYTFAKGLRSILRQDPDVILIGEIRDLETAEIAINAAMTGHLVLSTLHTNDAAGAIPRFLAIGVKPFLLAPALNAVMAQRLVRKLCESCKIEDKLDAETTEKVKKVLSDLPKKSNAKVDLEKLKFWKSSGCDACGGLGYKGRMGIYEAFIMSKEIEKVILSGAISEYQMRDLAKEAGMVTMVQDGLLKALDGITDVGEVFRVVD